MNIPDALKEGLAWIGFAAIVWQAAKCIASYTDHPSSHDIRRKPWTEDERPRLLAELRIDAFGAIGAELAQASPFGSR